MTTSPLSFTEVSKEIALRFLHSVVVVDDQAYLGKKVENIPENAETLVRPKRGSGSKTQSNNEVVQENSQQPKVAITVPENESLNAKTLIDTFALKGLVCAVLRPDEHEHTLTSKADHATQKSDIVILDWKIGDEPTIGDTAISLIKKIVETDSKDRLRLIAVYTSNPALVEVAEKVKPAISTVGEQANIKGLEVTRGPVKVVIYQKSGGSTQANIDRVVAEADLPDRLIQDFALMTQGLLSNVALSSLGVLRENTHRILSKFNSNLDPAYLSHRVLLNPPAEAELHPIPLLASEILDVLEDTTVKEFVSYEFVEKWLNYQISSGLSFDGKFEGLNHDQAAELVVNLVKDGIEHQNSIQTSKPSWNHRIKKIIKEKKDKVSFLTELFSLSSVKSAQESDLDFSILTTVRTKYDSPAPMLTLGSVLVEEVEGEEGTVAKKYSLCIQPLCDSVRLVNKRCFTFIPLDIATTPDRFKLVVKDGGQYVKLVENLRPYNITTIEFDPADKGEIVATKTDEDWLFFDSEGSRKFKWLADLKFAHAQRIVHEYSTQLSRVGLTESEWLRRMAR